MLSEHGDPVSKVERRKSKGEKRKEKVIRKIPSREGLGWVKSKLIEESDIKVFNLLLSTNIIFNGTWIR